MKLTIVINKECEEEVLIYANERTRLIDEIEKLVSGETEEIIGYTDTGAKKINAYDVNCFIVENNRVYALTKDGRYLIKRRLYQLEEKLETDFIKINQSCLANVKAIEKFGATISGSLTVTFKNGYCDYVSRRNLKTVKERLGL